MPPNLSRSPACGCNGVTYWNVGVSAGSGTAIGSSTECGNAARGCGGLLGGTCPAGVSCNYKVTQSFCSALDYGGTCWAVPSTCPGVVIGPTSRACGASTCTDECTLIKTQASWYVDNTCPQ